MRVALACLLLCALLIVPVGATSARPSKAASVAGVERAIRGCANRNREAADLGPLRASRVLGKAARLHARNMATRGFFDHEDPQGRGPLERVEIFDTRHEFFFVGENIAAGYPSVAVACQGWMNSSGHRENILNGDYTRIGGGFARGGSYGRYYVQVFAKGSQPSAAELTGDQKVTYSPEAWTRCSRHSRTRPDAACSTSCLSGTGRR